MRIFAGMKETLENYIRQDKDFRQLLLKQDGGIIKFWADHPDRDFDADLFEDYEKKIVEEYLHTYKQNRAIRSLPTNQLRNKSLDWYQQSKGSELKFLVALKPELIAIDEEFFKQALNYIEIYMADAYRESRRRKYAEGIPPQVFYNEVIEKYGPLGQAVDCLERVLQEYRGKTVHISVKFFFLTNIAHPGESPELEEEYNLQTEFDIKMFYDTFFDDGGYNKLRQAVKEIIDNSTQNLTKEKKREECCILAKDTMRKVHEFTRWVNNETYPMKETPGGELVPLITSEERHWLQNIMYENSPGATGTQKLTTMDTYFCRFIYILEVIGRYWAAQLLVRGFDMKELEKETGIIMSRCPGFRYYVDGNPFDKRGDCCVYDWSEAKNLLAKIKNKILHSPKEITWDDEKQCFKNAILNVMSQKREDGNYLFEKATQWIAVYRFAVDGGIMYDMDDPKEPQDKSKPQYAVFEKFAQELQLNANPPTRLPFSKKSIDSLNKPNYVRYNNPYPWSNDGITDPRSMSLYIELDDVYKALEEKYYGLVFQAERPMTE